MANGELMRNGIYNISANAFCTNAISSKYHGHIPGAVGDTRPTMYAEQMYLNAQCSELTDWPQWSVYILVELIVNTCRPTPSDIGYGMQPYVQDQMNVHSRPTLTQNHFFFRSVRRRKFYCFRYLMFLGELSWNMVLTATSVKGR